MHVAQYNIEPGGSKYSIRILMNGSKKKFYARAHDWNLMKTVSGVMDVLEKMVRKEGEKKREKERESSWD